MLHLQHIIIWINSLKSKERIPHMVGECVGLHTTWTISQVCLVVPRSEHWITRRWHWHLKGHFGIWGNPTSGTLGTVSAVNTSPDPGSSSIMKSRKPDWRKGRAQQAVTRSKERQADLMVPQAGSLEDERPQVKGLGGYAFRLLCRWLVLKLPCSVSVSELL